MVGRQSTETSTQGATPTRSLLFFGAKNPSTVRRSQVDAYFALQAADRHDDAGIGDGRPVGGDLPLQAAVNGSSKYGENSNANSESHSQALSDQVRVPGAMRSGCCP
jgi:hypothetical protein